MRNTTDEAYADNPALVQAQEALHLSLQQAARLVQADLTSAISVRSVADALEDNIPALRTVVEAHDAMLAAMPKKDPSHD